MGMQVFQLRGAGNFHSALLIFHSGIPVAVPDVFRRLRLKPAEKKIFLFPRLNIFLYSNILYKKLRKQKKKKNEKGYGMNRKIGMLITLIKQHVSRLLEKMLVEYGIDEFNGPQGRILYVLWNRDSISIQALADGTGLANATLTSMLDRMERRQLVKRLPAPGDRRKTLIALTPKARVLEQKYRAVSERMNELIYQGFSAEEAAQLEAYLERVLDNVRRTEMQQNNLKK